MTGVFEVDVHRQLKTLRRDWPHQLTMARLVARSLTTGRSALMQVSQTADYRPSYLLPALSWPQPLILAVPYRLQAELQQQDLSLLGTFTKPIQFGDRWPAPDWSGVLVVDPEVLLADRLQSGDRFPKQLPILFDQAQGLESWTEQALGVQVEPGAWQTWRESLPAQPAQQVLQLASQFAQYFLAQPLAAQTVPTELRQALAQLLAQIRPSQSPWGPLHRALTDSATLWATIHHESASFTLHLSVAHREERLARELWSTQPVILVGEGLDPLKSAPTFRRRLGLGEMTCVQFAPDRHEEEISLYLPSHLSDPPQVDQLTALSGELILRRPGPVVILVDSWAVKKQLATALAAQFGSRVGVDHWSRAEWPILVTDWEVWDQQATTTPTLIIANLPFPSWDHPLVHARIHSLKQEQRDWFREYLLPVTLGRLQRGVGPVRRQRGVVALLDGRIVRRSYGTILLEGLAPARKVNHLNRLDV